MTHFALVDVVLSWLCKLIVPTLKITWTYISYDSYANIYLHIYLKYLIEFNAQSLIFPYRYVFSHIHLYIYIIADSKHIALIQLHGWCHTNGLQNKKYLNDMKALRSIGSFIDNVYVTEEPYLLYVSHWSLWQCSKNMRLFWNGLHRSISFVLRASNEIGRHSTVKTTVT